MASTSCRVHNVLAMGTVHGRLHYQYACDALYIAKPQSIRNDCEPSFCITIDTSADTYDAHSFWRYWVPMIVKRLCTYEES